MSAPTTPTPTNASNAARRPAQPTAAPAPSSMSVIDPMKLLQQYYPWLIAAGFVGAVIGVGAYFGLRKVYPIWESEVVYEIRAVAENAADPFSSEGNRDSMEAYMNTMAKVLESDSILGRALEDRAVRETKWAEPFKDPSGNLDSVAALKELRKKVRARAISDTNMVLLTVGMHERSDSTEIASAISDRFLDDTGSRSSKEMRDLIQQFEKVVGDLAKDIEDLDSRTEALLAKQKLTALRQESTVQFQEVQNLQPAIVRMREDLKVTSTQLESYEELLNNPSGPQYPEAVREEIERRPILMERDATIAALKASLRAARESYGENHREVQLLLKRLSAEETERNNLKDRMTFETFNTVIENLRNSRKNQEAGLTELEERLLQARSALEDTTQALKQYEDWVIERTEKVQDKADKETKVSELRLLLARGSRIKVLQSALVPDSLAFPRPIPTVALSILLFGGAVGGIIALKEMREQRIRGPHDVALVHRAKALGMVPELSLDPSEPDRVERASLDRPRGIIAESVRQIRGAICKEMHGKGLRSLLVVGGLPGSGASSLISNLAINAAATDLRVLVIDANLRRPAMHTIFNTPEAPGLADLLLGRAAVDDAIRPTDIPNLSILTCGRRDQPVFERFTTSAMDTVFRELRARYDLVLVDSTPGVVAGDAIALASHCDAVVLVVRALSEKRGLVARLRNQLGDTGAEFLGVVVNAVKPSAGGYFKKNFQVTHEYGREAEETAETTEEKKPRKRKKKDDATEPEAVGASEEA